MTDIDLISFDNLVFHNVNHGIFQAAYYFPENYTMIVKTETEMDNNYIMRIYPNKYEVSLMQNNIPIIQTPFFKIKNQHFQTEIQISILMKQILLSILYGEVSNLDTEEITIQNLSLGE
jgi:hypothetical protein